MLKLMQTTALELGAFKMNIHEKTQVLIEALPYIKKYNNKLVVIKFGGNAMAEMNHVIEDIVLLKHIGIKPIVVHGGGPEIDNELKNIGIMPKFINGLRYTDDATMKVVEKVFNKLNKDIVASLKSLGVDSIDSSGNIKVKQKNPKLGLVGEITSINKEGILKILNASIIPIVSPIGVGEDDKSYNINADTAASHIAVSTNAEKLTILTNVDGVIINEKFLPHMDINTAEEGIKNGTINKGMIPKVEACIYAVKNSCPKAHLINGLIPHSLLLEIFTDKGIGTEIVYKNEY